MRVARDDMDVVNSSLHFINDFLRSMLDIHRTDRTEINIKFAPTDILRDVLKPVSTIINKRGISYQLLVECPETLVVMTDQIRLKQVVRYCPLNA